MSRRTLRAKAFQKDCEERFTRERSKSAQRDAYDQFLDQLAQDLALK